jgi:signal transduction histidine kinase
VAERANLAKSDFLSGMSHELRTPLSAILGFAQLIESGSPQPTLSQKRSIDQILKAGWYLLELINEILDLALIESGKLSLSMEPVSLTEVMYECEAMIEPQALTRGISVAFCPLRNAVLRARRPDTGEADPHQPAFQRDQVQQGGWKGQRRVHAEHTGIDADQRP